MAGQRINKEEANDLVRKYPWFSYAHLSSFTQIDINDPEYKEIASAVALHYPDPVHLDHLLNKFKEQATLAADVPIPGLVPEQVEPSLEEQGHYEPASTLEPTSFEEPVEPQDEISSGGSHENADVKTEPLLEIPKPVLAEPMETGISFEPLHTTDYFASQGIKLSEEQQSGDRLGKQMKSFTAWLKTMKKIHQENMPPEDVTVKIIAEKSNIDEEVVTESMAEVYASQGKAEKAREIYRKLSLINPAKSAYFAQKIDLLNN